VYWLGKLAVAWLQSPRAWRVARAAE